MAISSNLVETGDSHVAALRLAPRNDKLDKPSKSNGGIDMDKKKNVSTLLAMILTCICAIMWNINAILSFAYGFPSILRIICAIVWDICAVVWIFRYIKSRKNSTGD